MPDVHRLLRKFREAESLLERFRRGSEDGELFYTVALRPSERVIGRLLVATMREGIKQSGLSGNSKLVDPPGDPMFYRVILQSDEELSPIESREAAVAWIRGDRSDVKNVILGIQGEVFVKAALGRAGLGLPEIIATGDERSSRGRP